MSLEVAWFGMAEASAIDSRGAMTLVGINQNVVVAETLPALRKRVLVLHLRDSEEPEQLLVPGARLTVKMWVNGPDESEIFRQTATVDIGEKRWADIPGGANVTTEMQLNIEAYGRYRIHCEVAVQGQDELSVYQDLWAVEKQ